MAVHKSTFGDCTHGTVVRNRLAVRIAGSHPADRGSIPRYGNVTKWSTAKIWPIERFLCQNIFLLGGEIGILSSAGILLLVLGFRASAGAAKTPQEPTYEQYMPFGSISGQTIYPL